MKKWDERFLELARLIATWSKDPSTKVGAVITDSEHGILATGFNGFARHVNDDPRRYDEKMVKYKFIVHAEANAIIRGLRVVRGMGDATLYTTKFPCSDCAKLICQSGISQVIAPARVNDTSSWNEDASFAHVMMTEAGIIIQEY